MSMALPSAALQTPDAVQRVTHVSELRARTSAERARAEFFDMLFSPFSVLEHEHVGIFPERGLTITLPPQPPPPPGEPAPPPSPPETDADRISALACRSEIIIVGHPESQRALLNKSETFLFTDFEVAVERWIRPAGTVARTVSVSLAGGQVEVAGRLLTATYDPLPKLRQPYVFSLRKLPDSAGNVATEVPFKIEPASLDVVGPILSKPIRLDGFLQELERAVQRCAGAAK